MSTEFIAVVSVDQHTQRTEWKAIERERTESRYVSSQILIAVNTLSSLKLHYNFIIVIINKYL